MRAIDSRITATLALAAVSGARSMMGLATLSRTLARENEVGQEPSAAGEARLKHVLAQPATAKALTAAAAMEVVADKLPGIPDRVAAGPLAGRIAIGALIGTAIGELAGDDRLAFAVLGAAAALAGAQISFEARRRMSRALPSTLAAVLEDAALLSLASLGASPASASWSRGRVASD